jgi:YD repeat-containing protein
MLPIARTADFSYDYDNVGNRLSQTETTGGTSQQTTYQYDANDRLEWEKVNGTLKTSYQYDANGNTIAKSEMGVGTTTYDWNQDGRLIGVMMADGKAVAYTYDSEGIRTSSAIDGVKTDYLVDKNRDYAQVLEERVDDNLTVNYVYGLDLISQERGSQTSFYLVDGLGSTVGLVDALGNLTDTYRYDAFGKQMVRLELLRTAICLLGSSSIDRWEIIICDSGITIPR